MYIYVYICIYIYVYLCVYIHMFICLLQVAVGTALLVFLINGTAQGPPVQRRSVLRCQLYSSVLRL